jgi:hypothetical protein
MKRMTRIKYGLALVALIIMVALPSQTGKALLRGEYALHPGMQLGPLQDEPSGPSPIGLKVSALQLDNSVVKLPLGGSRLLRVQATFADGSTGDVTPAVSWRSVNPRVATISEGRVVGVGAGSTAIQARFADKSIQATVKISP